MGERLLINFKKLIVFSVCMLSACSVVVKPANYEEAVNLCSTNSGLRQMNLQSDSSIYKIVCNNGASFSRTLSSN